MRLIAVLRDLPITRDQAVDDLARCRRPVNGSFLGPQTGLEATIPQSPTTATIGTGEM